jgi:hypothetical protein
MGKQSAIWHPTLNDAKKVDEQSSQASGASKREQELLDAAFGKKSATDTQSVSAASDRK